MKVIELRIDEALVLSADSEELSGRERRLALEVLSAGDRERLRAMSDARADSFLAGRLLVHAGLASLAPRVGLPPSGLGMASAFRDGLHPIPKGETHPDSGECERGRAWAQERERQMRSHDCDLGLELPSVAALEVVCAHCGSSTHGKPSIPGRPVIVSIAYAGTAVFVALASAVDEVSALGIDAEELRQEAAPGSVRASHSLKSPLPPASLGADDSALDLERWTAIEAVLKADGRGLRVDPGQVRFEGEELARIAGEDASYRIHRAVVDQRYLVAVATR
ncbi:4'-phosphopantetheinyl transferase superfamily protein [Pseudoclavibacter sp. AY1F1]|uniref:4'-phosphopantetheinyl transferase family protein n=1 Tax=Pseudoclavibacter sp. AY1F1 TaxID=2080583 RepID=UPI0011B05497|nr:4'-phosphopantetheinyl transferase superfamily protein [Pseudoclavibacter sp. AY1F1]